MNDIKHQVGHLNTHTTCQSPVPPYECHIARVNFSLLWYSGFLPLNHYQKSVINSLRSFQHSKTPTSILQHSKTQLCSKIDISKTAWINTCTYIQKIFFKEHLSVTAFWNYQDGLSKFTFVKLHWQLLFAFCFEEAMKRVSGI